MNESDTTYKVAIFKDGNLCQERYFEILSSAAEWMENYAIGQIFNGVLIEIDNNKETELYGF